MLRRPSLFSIFNRHGRTAPSAVAMKCRYDICSVGAPNQRGGLMGNLTV